MLGIKTRGGIKIVIRSTQVTEDSSFCKTQLEGTAIEVNPDNA
jgi:hypothetical protein